MTRRDRRLGHRIPFQALLTSFIRDRPVRALAADLSDAGIRLHTTMPLAPLPGTPVVLELALPGVDDTLWCAGEVCYREPPPAPTDGRADRWEIGTGVLAGADRSIQRGGSLRAADLASGLGVRFVTMARLHARLLRDYCLESRRAHLGGLLARIRSTSPVAGLAPTAAL